MLSLQEAWGTKFFPTAVSPDSLCAMIFASAMNLTGARSLSESALQQNCGRAASIARPFAECAEFIQRCYNKHPEYRIVVLGQGGVDNSMPAHAIVENDAGEIVFDTYAGCRSQYAPGCHYAYNLAPVGMSLSVLAAMSLQEAYDALQQTGVWKDNAWSWDNDMPRGSDYL